MRIHLLALVLLACAVGGCSYYRVTEPASGKVYYTHDWMASRYNWTGTVRFTDLATGEDVTLQNSQVKEVPKDEALAAVGKQ